ncbi:MAG: hypothetical protein RR288_00775 [Oscillibacter sp.]
MNGYKRWACGLLAAALAVVTLCAAVVYAVDPCFYYRLPADAQGVFFNERYQNAGLARNTPADTVLLGTSLMANYRASDAQAVFGGTAVKLTLPDGYMSEQDATLRAAFHGHHPKRVVLALDPNILIRDESGLTGALPGYLYNETPLDDVQYLLNKDALYYSAYALFQAARGEETPLDDAFTWDDTLWWNHITALDNYERPEIVPEQTPRDAYLAQTTANLAVVTAWLQAYPDTEFDVFFPPYSILYWDKMGRLGETAAVLSALEKTCEALLPYENVKLYSFLTDREIVTDLDGYCDYIHHSGTVSEAVLRGIQAGENRLTKENYRETLAQWQGFVIDYDYEVFWDQAYWIAWNAQKAQEGNAGEAPHL